MRRRSDVHRSVLGTLAGVSALLMLAACGEPEVPPEQRVVGGDPENGRIAMLQYGCGSCHVIPGLRGASGHVGPPLTQYGLRGYVAGHAPNRPDHLVRFILSPASIAPGTAMPDLGVSEPEARDMAAYLYTLR